MHLCVFEMWNAAYPILHYPSDSKSSCYYYLFNRLIEAFWAKFFHANFTLSLIEFKHTGQWKLFCLLLLDIGDTEWHLQVVADAAFSICTLQTLTLARDYAATVKKPFPEVDEKILEEKDWPRECYVFEGKEKEPTIVFMPLFNRNNTKGLLTLVHSSVSCYTIIQFCFFLYYISFILLD